MVQADTKRRLIRVSEAAKRYNVSESTIWRWLNLGGPIPQPRRLSPGVVGWFEEDLRAWEDSHAPTQVEVSGVHRAAREEERGRRP